jgi:tRNA(fMet)-specific endonuclease VapC
MRFLLDTCVVSDFIKGQSNVVRRLTMTDPSQLVLSSITVMEIVFGLESNPTAKDRIGDALLDFIQRIHVEPFSKDCGLRAGFIRTQLKNAGTPVGPFDLLIAATATANDYTLVTSNEREFSQVSGLKIVNWRAESSGESPVTPPHQ